MQGIKKIIDLKVLSELKKLKRMLFATFGRDFYNIIKYGLSAPRHSQLFYLDPREVRQTVNSKDWRRNDTGKIEDGDWDLRVNNINDVKKVRMVKERILKGLTWEEVGAYRHMQELLEKHSFYDDCKSLDDVYLRYERVDKIIEALRSGGDYFKRLDISRGNFRESGGVYIHIGRNGEYIFGRGGCHRLAIAQALGIKKIPAQVGVVHKIAVENGTWRKILQESFKPDELE
ncbi:hypothetical protein SAMN05661010_00129 [Modicisalibacter muralis]|uniref:ParB-like nuclease domain-containing protein n=2 Tax=Modicisalibacter muralis TaxID=119000 RepID=A0A1G9EV84_9GAMM|nr:hypothetical protein SAMN05661010_00129 [Halomonas muralis]